MVKKSIVSSFTLLLVLAVNVIPVLADTPTPIPTDPYDRPLPSCPSEPLDTGALLKPDFAFRCSHCLPATSTPTPGGYVIPTTDFDYNDCPGGTITPVPTSRVRPLAVDDGNDQAGGGFICPSNPLYTPEAASTPTVNVPVVTSTPAGPEFYWQELGYSEIDKSPSTVGYFEGTRVVSPRSNDIVFLGFIKENIADNCCYISTGVKWIWGDSGSQTDGWYDIRYQAGWVANDFTGNSSWFADRDAAIQSAGFPSYNLRPSSIAQISGLSIWPWANGAAGGEAYASIRVMALYYGIKPTPTPEPGQTSTPVPGCSQWDYADSTPVLGTDPDAWANMLIPGDCFELVPAFTFQIPAYGDRAAQQVGWDQIRICPTYVRLPSFRVFRYDVPLDLAVVPLALFLVGLISKL